MMDYAASLRTAERPTIASELAVLVRLAVPISLSQFGLLALSLVELAILRYASPAQFGGAAIGRSITFLALAPCLGAVSALDPLAAQALGAREPRHAWRAFLATIAGGCTVALPCMLIAVALTWLLAPAGVAAELNAPARAFVIAQSPSIAFATLYVTGKGYLQAHHRTRAILVASVVANVVNVVLCATLVLGDDALAHFGLPRLGIKPMGALGAGIASSCAHVVLAACVLVPAWRLRPPASAPPEPPRPMSMLHVLRLGLPLGVQLLAEIGVFSLVAVLAGRIGTAAISANQIALALEHFTFMGVLGTSAATAVRVGKAIGEGRSPREAGLLGIALGATFMAACSAVFVAEPGRLVGLFATDAATARMGVALLLIAAAFQFIDGIQGVAAGALRGAGDMRFPLAINLACHWLIGLPVGVYLCFVLKWGAPGLWWGLVCGLTGVAALLMWRFLVITRRQIARV
jgi:MATE family multidrug resistance protein